MSVDATIEFTWGGDLRTFRLAIAQCLALEEKRSCGLAEVKGRLEADKWYIDDVRQPLRLGLIGAGTDAKQAQKLVDEFCADGKLMDSVLAAYAVICAAISAPANEPPVGKQTAATDTTEANASPPPLSTASEPS